MPDLAEVAAELYALTPGEFTAARNGRGQRARAEGDRDLAARVRVLRKPTVAAWAVNALVRRHPDQVQDLLALGGRLRAAQAARAGQELRDLVRRQHELMSDLRARAEALAAGAGLTLTDAVAAQVEGTLRAAMSDPAAEAALRTGLLTGDLQSTGFEPVEVGHAVALPDAPPVLAPGRPVTSSATPPEEPAAGATRDRREAHRQAEARADEARQAEKARQARRAAAERDVSRAEQDAQRADDVLRAARDAVDELARRRADLLGQIAELTARLHELEGLRTATERDERRAEAARDTAGRDAEAALRRARTARRRLDVLD